jgi:hypothetical protein
MQCNGPGHVLHAQDREIGPKGEEGGAAEGSGGSRAKSALQCTCLGRAVQCSAVSDLTHPPRARARARANAISLSLSFLLGSSKEIEREFLSEFVYGHWVVTRSLSVLDNFSISFSFSSSICPLSFVLCPLSFVRCPMPNNQAEDDKGVRRGMRGHLLHCVPFLRSPVQLHLFRGAVPPPPPPPMDSVRRRWKLQVAPLPPSVRPSMSMSSLVSKSKTLRPKEKPLDWTVDSGHWTLDRPPSCKLSNPFEALPAGRSTQLCRAVQ